MDYIKGADRKQAILFPESIEDYIHEDNPVSIPTGQELHYARQRTKRNIGVVGYEYSETMLAIPSDFFCQKVPHRCGFAALGLRPLQADLATYSKLLALLYSLLI